MSKLFFTMAVPHELPDGKLPKPQFSFFCNNTTCVSLKGMDVKGARIVNGNMKGGFKNRWEYSATTQKGVTRLALVMNTSAILPPLSWGLPASISAKPDPKEKSRSRDSRGSRERSRDDSYSSRERRRDRHRRDYSLPPAYSIQEEDEYNDYEPRRHPQDRLENGRYSRDESPRILPGEYRARDRSPPRILPGEYRAREQEPRFIDEREWVDEKDDYKYPRETRRRSEQRDGRDEDGRREKEHSRRRKSRKEKEKKADSVGFGDFAE